MAQKQITRQVIRNGCEYKEEEEKKSKGYIGSIKRFALAPKEVFGVMRENYALVSETVIEADTKEEVKRLVERHITNTDD